MPLEGELLVVHIYIRGYLNNQKRVSDDLWNDCLVASCMWAKVVDNLLPAIFFNPELTTTLGSEFMSPPYFRTDIAQIVSQRASGGSYSFWRHCFRVRSICGQAPASNTTSRDEFENGRR